MNRNFSENLKRIRKENNLSQEQLAEELGVSRQAISKWESGAAYPEMDKILFLCERFNLNIDDLLHKDIKEVKGEEEVRNNINTYIDEFFKFITDSINLFSRMSFKSKIKCIFEQCVLAFTMLIAFSIVFGILGGILGSLFNSILPINIFERIRNYVYGLYSLAAFVVGIIIMIKVFKTRYLDYYEPVISPKEKVEVKEGKTYSDEKIVFKENDKIIIRDPKHSEYRFLHAIGKIVIFGIKLFVLWIEFFLLMGLVSIGIAIVSIFLVSKTGLFFFGALISLIAAAIMDIVVILLFFNFIFNRKNDKKKMIWTFIISTLVFGLGCGMTFIGSLNFNIVENKDNLESHTIEVEMSDNSLIRHDEVNYVVEARDNIRIDYQTHPYYDVQVINHGNGEILLNVYCENRMEELRYILKTINEKKIIEQGYDLSNITVYASEENIKKLQSNKQKYYDIQSHYQSNIDELTAENNKLNDELRQKDSEIETLQNQLNEYKDIEG